MAANSSTDFSFFPQSKLDIRNCEDEQIRIPGSIQPHGFLLLLDDRLERIVAASENTEEFLEVPLSLILGALVEVVLEREVLGALKTQSNSNEVPGSQVYLGVFQMRGRLYSVVTHRVGSERILEFERLDELISSELTNQVFTNFVSKLNKLRDEQELCQALTEQIKKLTGYNRVLLYRFDEYGHGTVLCEETDAVLPSYLDLRFPPPTSHHKLENCTFKTLYESFRTRCMWLRHFMRSINVQSPHWICPCRFCGASHHFTSNTCEIWERCLRCRCRSSLKASFGDWSAGTMLNLAWFHTWFGASVIC